MSSLGTLIYKTRNLELLKNFFLFYVKYDVAVFSTKALYGTSAIDESDIDFELMQFGFCKNNWFGYGIS